MQPKSFPSLPTIVLRHRKENLKKCTLRGLEVREDFRFFTYPSDPYPALDGYLMLSVDSPPLTPADAQYGLFVIDATWRYAAIMSQRLPVQIMCRSLPREYRTAYPRRQEDCPLAEYGLASIEAIYIARHILGMNTANLLDHYHWKEQFLQKNFS